MERRTFVKTVLALVALPRRSDARRLGGRKTSAPAPGPFPITAQLSPVAGQPDWKDLPSDRREAAVRQAIDAIADHGFTGVECPLHLSADETRAALEHIRARGMYVDYDRTFDKGGIEIFGRDKPSAVSVFSPEYERSIRRNVETAFAEVKPFTPVRHIFFYQDEPFHAGPASLDYGEDARQAFRKRYGYGLPPDLDSARADPKVWQDVVEFRTSEFPVGWRQAYRIIKSLDPAANVILTHDSHSTFGAGVGSNAKVAMDDVFHWGGDFADTFVFDIYPHMMFDYRYGDCGVLREPRFSQMHYALGQMRNLAYTYGKRFGFWFGTFNRKWFSKFMGPDVREAYWAERETSLTAIAHGANLLISGYNMPEDSRHWESLGEGLRLVQRAGPELLETPRQKARACFLFPRTQYIQLQEEYWNVGVSYELFLEAFGELDVLHEDQLTDSRVAGYRILSLFDVRLLPAEAAQRIEAFVRDGGIVIADCVPNLDRYARPSQAMSRVFGVRDAATARVRRTGVWVPEVEKPHWFVQPDPKNDTFAPVLDSVRGTAFDRAFDFAIASPRSSIATDAEVLLKTASGQPAVLRRTHGKGRVYLLGFCAQDSYFQTFKAVDEKSREQLRTLLRAITEDAGVRAHVCSSAASVEAALRANGRGAYLFAINHGAKNAATKVRLEDIGFDVAGIVDLATGRDVPFERNRGSIGVSLDVARDEPRLLRLFPKQGASSRRRTE